MTTYETLDAARNAVTTCAIQYIIEIDHATAGRAYIQAKCNIDTLRKALSSKPMPEIVRVIASHDVRPVAQAPKVELPPLTLHCDRCKCVVTPTAYSQQQWTRLSGSKIRITAYYCDSCKTLLSTIGAGEHSALEDRKCGQ